MAEFKSLLPVNSTATERALEQALARIEEIQSPLASLWDPATCPEALLPWLAWTFSVETWESGWPEATKREVIAASVSVHRHKGTLQSVLDALAARGIAASVSEWFEHGGAASTFRLDVRAADALNAGIAPDAELVRQVDLVLRHTKPVHVHYGMRLIEEVETRVQVGAGAAHEEVARGCLEPMPPTHHSAASAFLGAAAAGTEVSCALLNFTLPEAA